MDRKNLLTGCDALGPLPHYLWSRAKTGLLVPNWEVCWTRVCASYRFYCLASDRCPFLSELSADFRSGSGQQNKAQTDEQLLQICLSKAGLVIT